MLGRIVFSIPALLTVGLIAACSTPLDLTPAQLAAQNRASVYVADVAAWNLAIAPGRGYEINIASVNGKSVCGADYCPSRITVPAGQVAISLLCSMQVNNLLLPRRKTTYHGQFLAGHIYQIRPVSLQSRCRVQVRDVTDQTS